MPLFCSNDLHLDPMTLIYESNLDDLKMCVRTRNEISRSRLSKVIARAGHTHTHRQTLPNALPQPHSRVVTTENIINVDILYTPRK